MNNLDKKVWNAEKEAHMAMSCVVSQSWLLQVAHNQIGKLNSYLKNMLDENSYSKVREVADLDDLGNIVQVAQDACMDVLDLEAKQVANLKVARRQLWLRKTRWSDDVKETKCLRH